MTRTVPVRRLISLMTFALGLSIALPSHALTVSEAVAAARNTQLPDIDGIMANHDGVLDAVGGGSTEGLDDVKNLWADGKGTLTGSAEATVIECRGKTDTTCRAIQVLDKGFPERPVIGEDVLAGRDEIVNNPTVTPDDNGTCKDVTIEADPVEVTKILSTANASGSMVPRRTYASVAGSSLLEKPKIFFKPNICLLSFPPYRGTLSWVNSSMAASACCFQSPECVKSYFTYSLDNRSHQWMVPLVVVILEVL